MKWQNKGYEFDKVAKKILSIKAIYLFGAQSSGRVVFNKYKDDVIIKGFIDNDSQKQGINYLSIPVFSLDDVNLQENEAIVISVQSWSLSDIEKQLEKEGYKNGENFFRMQIFFPVFSLCKYNELVLPSLNSLPSTICNLNCKYCLNFTPYIKKHSVRSFETMKSDFDLLFSKIDYIFLFHITGGEPFLYKELSLLLWYVVKNYGNKIGQFEVTTNGTILPSDELLKTFKDLKVSLIVDDYTKVIGDKGGIYKTLLEKLNYFSVNYRVQKAENWLDLEVFDTDNTLLSDEELVKHYTHCDVMWSEYRDGKITLCNYAAYADFAGISELQDNECFDLNDVNDENKSELLEFRLGYSDKGYTKFCKRCAGVRNTKIVLPAEQM